jgi:hypothetical protein
MAPLSAANSIGAANITWLEGEAVVFSFAVGRADWMDRRQIQDVKVPCRSVESVADRGNSSYQAAKAA